MDSSQDRNLPASQQKLDKARKDGQVPQSRDLAHLAVLATGALALFALLPTFGQQFGLALQRQYHFDAALLKRPESMIARLEDMAWIGAGASAAVMGVVALAVVLSKLAMSGWVLSLKPLMPDFKRINPLSGIGRLFGKQHVIDALKTIVIATLMVVIGALYLKDSLPTITAMLRMPPASALNTFGSWITNGLALLLLASLALGLIDVPLQFFMHRSQLKMSHEEVKQENKEANGNPQLKGKQRQRAREIAQRNSITQVPKADLVVMNPTHYAVALKYDEATMQAPQVVAKGADLLALKIKEIARHHQVMVLESPPLARALYAHAELDREIPGQLYSAVAQVLAYVYRVKQAMKGNGKLPDSVPQPAVPPELDPHNTRKQPTAGVN